MAKYRVLEKMFINNSLVEEGAIVEYEGRPGKTLELIEESEKPTRGKSKDKSEGEI